MSTVTFDEEQDGPHFRGSRRGASAWLIRRGIVHTPAQATSLLILVSFLCFALAGFVMLRSSEEERFNPGRHFVPVYEN